MVKIMETPIKMDDLGVPLFLETPFRLILTLEVQSTKQRMVFRMIHGARIPDPTMGQSLVFGLPGLR